MIEGRCHGFLLVHFANIANHTTLLGVELTVSDEITGKLENKSFTVCHLKCVFQTLNQTLQTTKLRKYVRLTRFQKPQFSIRFNLDQVSVHPCRLKFVFAVLFIPSFIVLSFYIYVSLSLVETATI